jgi:hypothetical protein
MVIRGVGVSGSLGSVDFLGLLGLFIIVIRVVGAH